MCQDSAGFPDAWLSVLRSSSDGTPPLQHAGILNLGLGTAKLVCTTLTKIGPWQLSFSLCFNFCTFKMKVNNSLACCRSEGTEERCPEAPVTGTLAQVLLQSHGARAVTCGRKSPPSTLLDPTLLTEAGFHHVTRLLRV